MSDLFPDLDEFMQEREAASAAAYEQKILSKLYRAWYTDDEYRADSIAAGDEFGFLWFNTQRDLPIRLCAAKLAMAPIQLIRSVGMTKSPLWKQYFEFKQQSSDPRPLGMFFTVPEVGQFVMHNSWSMPLVAGFNTIVRQARSIDNGLVIAPLDAFIAAMKERI